MKVTRATAIKAALIASLATVAAPSHAQAPLAAQSCMGCHGPQGGGSLSVVSLAGRPKADIEAAMRAFQKNERPATIMGRVARGFTEAEIERIAAFYAALPNPNAQPAAGARR